MSLLLEMLLQMKNEQFIVDRKETLDSSTVFDVPLKYNQLGRYHKRFPRIQVQILASST